SREAKRLLEVYRPSGADAADPKFAAALDRVKQDPKLALWFERQRRFDSEMARSLQKLTAPDDLKASILATRRSKVLRPGLWQDWRTRAALAASIVALAVAGGFLAGAKPARFSERRQQLVDQAWNGESHLEFESSDLAHIKQWLARHGAYTDFTLPAGLRD